MLNLDLSPNARILYFLIDDKAGESGEMWWHWRKIAIAMGSGHSQLFVWIEELMKAEVLSVRREGSRVFYKTHSGKPERPFRKTGMKRAVSITEPENEPIPLTPASGGISCEVCMDSPNRIEVSKDGRAPVRMWCPNCGGRRARRTA